MSLFVFGNIELEDTTRTNLPDVVINQDSSGYEMMNIFFNLNRRWFVFRYPQSNKTNIIIIILLFVNMLSQICLYCLGLL